MPINPNAIGLRPKRGLGLTPALRPGRTAGPVGLPPASYLGATPAPAGLPTGNVAAPAGPNPLLGAVRRMRVANALRK